MFMKKNLIKNFLPFKEKLNYYENRWLYLTNCKDIETLYPLFINFSSVTGSSFPLTIKTGSVFTDIQFFAGTNFPYKRFVITCAYILIFFYSNANFDLGLGGNNFFYEIF